MMQIIKKLLGEIAGVDFKMIDSDLSLKEDLFLDESDIEDILYELENHFGVEFEDPNRDFVYVADLIAFVKESV